MFPTRTNPTPRRGIRRTTRLWAIALVGLSAACGEASTGTPTPSLLTGLSQSTARDSSGTSIPNAGTEGPGSVRGTVMGPSAPGSVGDTLSTSPRVAGARIAAFLVTGGTQANPTLGPEVTSAVTGADGKFTTVSIPGGNYAFTVTPPAGSIYQGVWVTTRINTASNVHPWWVVLPKK